MLSYLFLIFSQGNKWLISNNENQLSSLAHKVELLETQTNNLQDQINLFKDKEINFLQQIELKESQILMTENALDEMYKKSKRGKLFTGLTGFAIAGAAATIVLIAR